MFILSPLHLTYIVQRKSLYIFIFLLIELVNIYNWIHLDEKGKVAQSNVIYVSLIHFLETSFGFFCALVTAWTVSKQRCRTRQCKRAGWDVSRSNDGMTQSRKPIQTSFQEDHFAFVHVWASKWYLINNASNDWLSMPFHLDWVAYASIDLLSVANANANCQDCIVHST